MDDETAAGASILSRWSDIDGKLELAWKYVVKTDAGAHKLTLKGMSSSTLAHSSFTTKAPAVLPAKPAQVNS
jgi:hypothetical protein